jgi:ribokinase
MVGRIADDGFGRTLIDGLNKEGIDTSLVKVTPNCSSGLAVIGVEDSGQNSITVISGANGFVTPDDVLAAEELFPSADVLLLQFEIPLPAVKTAVELAHRHSVKVILDPAPSVSVVPADLLQVDVICPNETEAESLSGQVVDSVETAKTAVQRLGSQGSQVSIITLGSQGAVVFDGKTVEHVPPFDVKAVDTTAAGDAFAAAFGIALAEQMSVSEATRFAAAAGALATTQHGAQPAMPTRDAVEALLRSM